MNTVRPYEEWGHKVSKFRRAVGMDIPSDMRQREAMECTDSLYQVAFLLLILINKKINKGQWPSQSTVYLNAKRNTVYRLVKGLRVKSDCKDN